MVLEDGHASDRVHTEGRQKVHPNSCAWSRLVAFFEGSFEADEEEQPLNRSIAGEGAGRRRW